MGKYTEITHIHNNNNSNTNNTKCQAGIIIHTKQTKECIPYGIPG